jgi:hypothetical protein
VWRHSHTEGKTREWAAQKTGPPGVKRERPLVLRIGASAGLARAAGGLINFSDVSNIEHHPWNLRRMLTPSPPRSGIHRWLRVLHAPALAKGVHHMPHYRAYFIGRDGHFEKAIELACSNDNVAIKSAKQLVDGHDVELWQQDRKITKFDAKE